MARVFWQEGAKRTNLYYILVVQRSVVFTLAIIIVSILLFLTRYPLRLHRNSYVSTVFFSAVFLSEAVEMLIDSLSPHFHSTGVDVAQIGFAAACFVGWAWMLKPEIVGAPVRVTFENPHERELLQQLESLNRLLTRAGRQ